MGKPHPVEINVDIHADINHGLGRSAPCYHALMKKPLSILSLLLLLLGVLIFWSYHRYVYTSPLNEVEQKLLTPDWKTLFGDDWSPWRMNDDGERDWDPAGAYNAWIDQMPHEERAWPIILDAFYAYPEVLCEWVRLETDVGDERWAESQEILQRPGAQLVLDQLVRASQRPYLGYRICAPAVGSLTEPGGITTYDPDEAAVLRDLGYMQATLKRWPSESFPLMEDRDVLMRYIFPADIFLVAGANQAMLDGDAVRFTQLIESADKLGRLGCEFPYTINQTVRLVIASTVQKSIRLALENSKLGFTDEQLARLDEVLQAQQQVQHRWRADALSMYDTIRRSLRADGHIDLVAFAGSQPLGPASSLGDQELGKDAKRLLYTINMITRDEQFPGYAQDEPVTTLDWLRTQRYKMSMAVYQFVEGAAISHGHRQSSITERLESVPELRELIAKRRSENPSETTNTVP